MKKNGKRIAGMLLIFVFALGMFPCTAIQSQAAGNSFSAATSISLGSTYSGEITSSNQNDYYKYTLSKSGSVNITVTSTAKLSYIIYDSKNNVVWNKGATVGFNAAVELTAGTYYLKVTFYAGYSTYGSYNFKLSFTSANESFAETQGGSNNTPSTASSISMGNTYYGQIAINDTDDYYKFTLSKSGSVNITVNSGAKLSYIIYDSKNNVVWNKGATVGFNAAVELTAGTYYLKVTFYAGYSTYGSYNFNLTFLVQDTTKPTGSISSTNSVATSQTATLYLYDNIGVAGYYWGTSSSYSSNSYFSVSSSPASTSVTKTVSSSGTYYLTVKDTAGNVSTTYSITYYKTTLNANGGSVSPSYVITKSGSSFTFPTPTKSGYECKGWSTSSTATSGSSSLSPSGNNTYYAVWNVPVVLSSISVYTLPNKTVYYIGNMLDTTGLQIKLTYSDNSTKIISSGFTASDISSSSAGTKTVTVSYSGKTTTFNVTVNLPTVSLSSVNESMTLGDTTTLTATTTPSGQTVTWTSSDTSVATVSNGTITAEAAGTAIITAKFTYNGNTYSETCSVIVADSVYDDTNGNDPTIPEQFTQTVSLAENDEFGRGKASGNAFEIAGVQIRTEGTPGLRFAARLSENLLQEVTDAYGEENVSYGILLQLTDHVSGELTEANIDGKTIGKGGAVAVEGVKTFRKHEDAGYFYYTAVITDIPESFYETKITARAYVKVGNTYYFADETDGTSYDVPGASAVGGGYSVSLRDVATYVVTNKITGWEAVQELYGGEE